MEKYKKNHLLFLKNFAIPYDDNMSERSLRKVNSRQKMAGKFLKASGAKMFCKILSIIETPKKENATDVKIKIIFSTKTPALFSRCYFNT